MRLTQASGPGNEANRRSTTRCLTRRLFHATPHARDKVKRDGEAEPVHRERSRRASRVPIATRRFSDSENARYPNFAFCSIQRDVSLTLVNVWPK
jgi:hypothetical protein